MKKLNFLFSMMLLAVFASYGQTQLISPSNCLPAGAGTNMPISFTMVPQAASGAVLTVYYQGDFDGTGGNLENADIFDENGVLIGSTTPIGQCAATRDSNVFNIPVADIAAWAADGNIDFDFTPTANVNPTLCNPCGEIQFKLEYAPLTGPDDAAMTSIDAPGAICAGASSVEVTIRNSGTNQLDSVMVNWEVNGIAQPSFNYIGLLDTLGGMLPNSAQVVLGNGTFTTGTNTLKVYTSLPNGVADTSNLNDTITITIQTATPPTGIITSNATLTSIDLTILGGAGTSEYEIGLPGFAPGTGAAVSSGTSTSTTFTAGGLTQGTVYDVYVRTDCGGGDISGFTGPVSFNSAYGLPFLQDFELFPNAVNANPYPEGWSSNQAAGAFVVPRWESELANGFSPGFGTGAIWDNTNYGNPGTYMYLETSGGVQVATDLESPSIFIDPSVSTIEVSFYHFMFGPAVDSLQLIIDTNGVENVVTTIIGQQVNAQTDPWTFFSQQLTGYQGQDIILKFRATNQPGFAGGDIAIDDISVTPILPLNAGVLELINPSGSLCPGSVTPTVGVKNFGSTAINSFDVVADINGVLDTVNFMTTILPGDTAPVNLNSFMVNATTVYDVKFYTILPNGMMDQFAGDDTLAINGVRTGLNGTYTLDPALPASASNLVSFAELQQVVNNFGICGNVIVNVAAGTYNEELLLENIPGADASNRLTIDGGDSSLVTITSNATTDNTVIGFNGTSYVTIKNMTIANTSTTTFPSNQAIHFRNESNYDSIIDCRVTINPTATFSQWGIVASGATNSGFQQGNNANHTVIMGCSIDGGDASIRFVGDGGQFGNGWTVGNQFIGNTMTNMDQEGIFLDDQDSVLIANNIVRNMRSTSTFNGAGISAFDLMNFVITANDIVANWRGINLTNANSATTPTMTSEISNNMLSTVQNSGLYTEDPLMINYFNNSIYSQSSNAAAFWLDDGFGTPATNLIDCRNNAVYSTGTFAFQVDNADTIFIKLDNMAYNTDGPDLVSAENITYTDLPAYKLASPSLNSVSIEGDPQFISATDLHVIGGFINDMGDNSVGLTVDIDGDVRPISGSTIIDIGADEFDPPACPPSTNLGSANVGLTIADIFWDGMAGSYEYEVTIAGAGQGSGTPVMTALDSVSLTGLTPSTSYEFYVREICGRGDTSIWIGPEAFNTANAVPFLEDFETFNVPITGNPWPKGWSSTTTFNPRWESETGTGVNINSFNTGPFFDNTTPATAGGTYIYLETSGGAGGIADFVSPPVFIDVNQTNVTLEFAVHMFGATMGDLEVLVDSNGVENSLLTIVGQQQTAQGDPYILNTASIAGYQGQSIQLIFRGTSGTSFTSDIAIDDVRIFEPSAADGAVTDIIRPTSGCGLGTTDSVEVEISNVGTGAISGFPVSFEFNGGAPVTETFTGTIAPGATANYTFNGTVNLSVAGSYSLVAYTDVPSDGDLTNDTSSTTVNSIPIVGGFPYAESFESGNAGWIVNGVSTFALGAPSAAIIDTASDGTQAWVTNLTGVYNNGESGWVESPCFDFSTLNAPTIFMDIWWNSENGFDGAVLQSSIDGGTTWQQVGAFGDPNNWYNDPNINGIANLEPSLQGWAGRNPGSGGWVTAEHALNGLAGVGGVILRVAFGSDGSVQDEGFAFDNVRIREAAPYDITMISIESPVSGAYTTTTDSVRVTLANIGSDTANMVGVNYVIDGGAIQSETIAQILPGDTVNYTFTNSVATLPGAGGTSTIEAYTVFALDTFPLNDSISSQFENFLKSVPFIEGFEGYVVGPVGLNSQGNWSSTRPNNPRWEVEDASGFNENSVGTGPFYDRTTQGVAGGNYVYLECSGGLLNDNDTLRSPDILIPPTAGPIGIHYSYHMFGTNMGILETYIEAGGVLTRYDSIGGQQQLAGDSLWNDTIIPLPGTLNGQTVKLVFIGYRGNGFDSDMSIDEVGIDFLTGINEASNDLNANVSVTPNPSNGEFTLKVNTLQRENFNMSVRDVNGKVIYQENFNVNGSYVNDLDFTSYAKGVYFMQIQTETGSKVEKLIIQ